MLRRLYYAFCFACLALGLFLGSCTPARAQTIVVPACVPKTFWTPLGTGTDWVRGSYQRAAGAPVASFRAWWCPKADGSWEPFYHRNIESASVSSSAVEKALDTAMRSLDPVAALQTLVAANTYPPTPEQTDAWLGAGALALQLLDTIKPAVVTYAVKANGTSTTRPVYTLVNGVRGTSSVGRATVGERCNVTRPTLASGADLWAEFGPGFVSGVVALCAKQ